MQNGARVPPEKIPVGDHYLRLEFLHHTPPGAYETTMELCEPKAGSFQMRGHPDGASRHLHEEAVALKLHEVVAAVEITAAVT